MPRKVGSEVIVNTRFKQTMTISNCLLICLAISILTLGTAYVFSAGILRKADVMILPYEQNTYTICALPNKVCHYLYLKKPLIATRLSSLERYLGDSIYFVDKPNPRKLADAIQRLYTDSDLRRRLGDKGYEIIMTKNNWENVSRKLINCYYYLLSRTSRSNTCLKRY